MLHARLEIAQVLDQFQVRCVITEFAPGTDPTTWVSPVLQVDHPDSLEDSSALSTVIDLIRLWSEMTIR